MVEFSDLVGKTLNQITVSKDGDQNDVIYFSSTDGLRFKLYHSQDCCECVEIEEIIGDLDDLVGSPILQAEEVEEEGDSNDSYSTTWTFYKIATIKGSVTIRWFGSSNGYYSESVYFSEDIYDIPHQWEMHRNGLYGVPDPALVGLVYDPSSCSWVKP